MAECDLAEVFATGFDLPRELRFGVAGRGLVSVAPTTSIPITIIGPSVAIAVIGPVRSIAIRVWSVVTATVVVAGLFKQRVGDSRTIERGRGHRGRWAGAGQEIRRSVVKRCSISWGRNAFQISLLNFLGCSKSQVSLLAGFGLLAFHLTQRPPTVRSPTAHLAAFRRAAVRTQVPLTM